MKHSIKVSILLSCILLSILDVSCSRAPLQGGGRSTSNLAIAVWDGPIGRRMEQFGLIYSHKTGIQVSVESFPEWQYTNLVVARLLAGTAPWDVIYLKGEWVPELIQDHALMDLAGLLTPEQARRLAITEFSQDSALYGLAVDGSLPFLFYRKDQISSAFLHSFDTVSGYRKVAGQLPLPSREYPAGAALGEQDLQRELLPYGNVFAYSHFGQIKPGSLEASSIKTLLQLFCGINTSSFYHPDSKRWGEAELVQALQNGEVASAVLWANPDLAPQKCTKDDPTCKNGVSQIGFQFFPSWESHAEGVPRLMNAWTVPGQELHADKAAGWMQWVISAEGEKTWLDLGGIPLGNDDQAPVGREGLSIAGTIQAYFFSADPAIGQPGSEGLQAKFNSYFADCVHGKLSPEDLLGRYAQDVSSYQKQHGLEP